MSQILEYIPQTTYGRLDTMCHSERWIEIYLNGGFRRRLKISGGIQDDELISLWGKMVQAKSLDGALMEIRLMTFE